MATEKPDKRLASDLNRDLDEDFSFQARLFAFATQLLTADICDGDDMQNLRQKPDFPCILQQDQGGEWVDVFDYGSCMAGLYEALNDIKTQNTDQQSQQYYDQAVQVWKDYEDNYTGTSASYDPTLVTTGSNGLTAKAGLCETLNILVKQAAADSLKVKQDEAEGVNAAVAAIAVGVALIGVLAVIASGGLLGPVLAAWVATYAGTGAIAFASASIGLTTAGLTLWAQNIKETAQDVFEDNAAINELACIWYGQLKTNADISKEVFQTDIDLTDALETNTAALYDALKPLITQDLYYAVFLKQWKKVLQLADAGISPDCTCPIDTPPYLLQNHGAATGAASAIIEYKGDNIWEFELGHLSNDYGYMEISVSGGPSYVHVDDAQVITGDFTIPGIYQWSTLIYPSGSITSSVFSDIIGADVILFGLFLYPGGGPWKLRLTVTPHA